MLPALGRVHAGVAASLVAAAAVWAKTRDLQNCLGFTVSLARQVAERNPFYRNRLDELRQLEALLQRSRLTRVERPHLRSANQGECATLRLIDATAMASPAATSVATTLNP